MLIYINHPPPPEKKEKRSGIKDALQLIEVTTDLMQEDSEKANKYRKYMKDLYEKGIYMRQVASNRLLTVFESYVDIMERHKAEKTSVPKSIKLNLCNIDVSFT